MFEAGARSRLIGKGLISYRVDVVGDNRMVDILRELEKDFTGIRSIELVGPSKVKGVPPNTFTYDLTIKVR